MHVACVQHPSRRDPTSAFSRVGENTGPAVAAVSSWSEAIQYCDLPQWEDLQLEMHNQYCEYIAKHAPERMAIWNDTMKAVKRRTVPLVERKIADVVRYNKLPKVFEVQVNYDIGGFCIEVEYDDVCPPGFFTRLGAWYLDGHFPCGWWGQFPQGKLIVY